jgi:hypothetical protein
MLERRWLSCFVRLLSEFKGRFVQLASLGEVCAAQLELQRKQQRSGGGGDVTDEPPLEYANSSSSSSAGQGLEPTGREKEELLHYFLAGPLSERKALEVAA